MAKEIERKFLVDKDKLPPLSNPQNIIQGYIPSSNATVRVRINNDKAFLTLKGKTKGISRSEFEYPIPIEDAKDILDELCIKPYIEKKRYNIHIGKHIWEIDVFEGQHEGLIVAEIELSSEDEAFEKPSWVIKDVSHDYRYKNAYLVKHSSKDLI
jgi:adenylate cyclase